MSQKGPANERASCPLGTGRAAERGEAGPGGGEGGPGGRWLWGGGVRGGERFRDTAHPPPLKPTLIWEGVERRLLFKFRGGSYQNPPTHPGSGVTLGGPKSLVRQPSCLPKLFLGSNKSSSKTGLEVVFLGYTFEPESGLCVRGRVRSAACGRF